MITLLFQLIHLSLQGVLHKNSHYPLDFISKFHFFLFLKGQWNNRKNIKILTNQKHTEKAPKNKVSRPKTLRGLWKTKQMGLDCWRDQSEPKNITWKVSTGFTNLGLETPHAQSQLTGDEGEPWGRRMVFNQRLAKAERVHLQAE